MGRCTTSNGHRPQGNLRSQIARLVESFGPPSCDVLTTNYDLVLDDAISEIVTEAPATSTGARRPKAKNVTHLHGVVTPRGRIRGELVLSDRDYVLMQEDSAWQQTYFASRFAESTCVFVGASLTDPNLLRYLFRSETTKPHYAIFVRQQDAEIYAESAPDVIDLREKTSEARWSNAGIQPLHTDFYSQSAQLLHEVLHRRKTATLRRVYQPLPKRLLRWRNKLDKGVLTTQLSPFRSVQERLHAVMHRLLQGVRADLVDSGHRPEKNEGLGINMWVYDPRSESLTNWASADRILRDPKTMEPHPIAFAIFQ